MQKVVVVPGHVPNLFLHAQVVPAPSAAAGIQMMPLPAFTCIACGWTVVTGERDKIPAHQCSGLMDKGERDALEQRRPSRVPKVRRAIGP